MTAVSWGVIIPVILLWCILLFALTAHENAVVNDDRPAKIASNIVGLFAAAGIVTLLIVSI